MLIVELLKTHKPCHRSVHIQPRGLTNRGNWCYVNAVSLIVIWSDDRLFYYLLSIVSVCNLCTMAKHYVLMGNWCCISAIYYELIWWP